ncbi:MAG TPA: pseudouridine synthase [Lachnospiraceae bacterium]|nr:pseudouridine synthase [Lachnospiraceae bacterium]
MMRLDKFLCETGGYSRSEAKELLKKGNVTLNGQLEKKAEYKINETLDTIKVNGIAMNYEKNHYYLLHKPAGVITATEDNRHHTVLDLLDGIDTRKLFPVGRLDKDTEGLLLITDDGELSHRLLSPRKQVEKKYYAILRDVITSEAVSRLEHGVDIGDTDITLPAKVKCLNEREIELIICEGRYHQVKRMLQAVNNEVKYLKRLSMGSLCLPDDLSKGMFRRLTTEEVYKLKQE